jgi:hypothetical protein
MKKCLNCGAKGDWTMFVTDKLPGRSGYWCEECYTRVYFNNLVEQAQRERFVNERFRAVKAYVAACARPDVLDEIEYFLTKLGARIHEAINPREGEACTKLQDS